MGGKDTQFSFPEAITTTNFLKILLELFSVWSVFLLLTELFFKLGDTTYNPRFLVSFEKSEDPASTSDKTRSLEPRLPASLKDTSAGQVTTASPGLAPVCLNQPDPGGFPFSPPSLPRLLEATLQCLQECAHGNQKEGCSLAPHPLPLALPSDSLSQKIQARSTVLLHESASCFPLSLSLPAHSVPLSMN